MEPGEQIGILGHVQTSAPFPNTGKERDAETKLDFFRARYYSGTQGRFTSPDIPPADLWEKDPQNSNLYAYARNNPYGAGTCDDGLEGWQFMGLVLAFHLQDLYAVALKVEVYPHGAIRHLKQIHSATHPAYLPKKGGAIKPEEAAREERLNALAAEQDEDNEQEP